MNILYAEDELGIAEPVTDILSSEGHIITHVSDGQTAYDMLQDPNNKFDLLLTDHMMPKLKGAELIIQLRRAGSHIPILVTSGSLHLEKEYDQLQLLKHVSLLPKPFDLDKLIETIKEYEDGRYII